MGPIGFSTGALAKSDFRRALALQNRPEVRAVELSALREDELDTLLQAIPGLDLSGLDYVSFHAPSRLERMSERELIDRLHQLRGHVSSIIVHPDIMGDVSTWRVLGDALLLENMDQRKPVCRTAREMAPFFDALPAARFCFDIGHARQVDSTMSVAVELLVRFGDRLAELHLSEVNADCRHVALTRTAVHAYQRVATLFPSDLPVIIESMIPPDDIEKELLMAYQCFACVRDREVVA